MDYSSGNYYHIFNRGVEKRIIFNDDNDYIALLKRIQNYLPEYPISLIAYCLMPTHYHMLIFTEKDNSPGRFIQRLFNSFTQGYNLYHNRSGTLFEGRVKKKLILENKYLFQIVRYIHLNPVHAGLVRNPEDWIYSNYREFIGLRKGKLFDKEFLTDQFGSFLEYKDFVEGEVNIEMEEKIKKYYLE